MINPNRNINSANKKLNSQAVQDFQEIIRSWGRKINEFDGILVLRLVDRITISDEKVTVLFKSGQSIDN